jgi:sulfopropanediol 3-dehydrogenase
MQIMKEAGRLEADAADVAETVAALLSDVRRRGDDAVLELTKRFDGVELESLEVPAAALKAAYDSVERKTVESLEFAAEQLRGFASRQLSCIRALEIETLPGVTLGHRLTAIRLVGAYVPAGRYPLPSTALHSVIPAKVAGVGSIAACSPPSRGHAGIHPAVLVALDIAGVDRVFSMGGAQAIAAFAFGTESVPAVNLVVGPGNRYVTEAKRQVSGSVGIDMLAGPSEVLIIADGSANPRWVAVDLLAKCEHDPNSISWLVTTSADLARAVLEAIPGECETLGTGELALQTWIDNGRIVVVDSLDEAVAVSEEFAPEHLQVMAENDEQVVSQLSNYGSLFVGAYAPVAFGDYVSGTNHTLPTMHNAKFMNGLWVGTFLKTLSIQRLTGEGSRQLARHCAHLAGVEGLLAHERSAELRMQGRAAD